MSEGIIISDLIELKYITRELNALLGEEYVVRNNDTTSVEDTDRLEVLMQAARKPFAVDGINSETIDLNLEFYVPLNDDSIRDKVMQDASKILGHVGGIIDIDEENSYNYAMFLQYDRPLGQPEVSEGKFVQVFSVTGQMLVSHAKRGAYISNTIKTKVDFDYGGTAYSGYIPILQHQSDLGFGTETFPTGNYNTLSIEHNVMTRSFTVRALLLNRNIDRAILMLIRRGMELDSIITVTEEYPDGETYVSVCRYISGNVTHAAGAYITYTLGLQEVSGG